MYRGEGANICPPFQNAPGFSTNQYLYDHHDSGGFDYRQGHLIFLKYMFPNDPAIDYWYHQNLPSIFAQGNVTNITNSIFYSMFGLDPNGLSSGTPTTLPQVGTAEKNRLIKYDPQEGTVVTRSGWNETDAELLFDCSWEKSGHWHAEQNSCSFFALGRAWAFAPGYHMVDSDAQSAVLIQDPAYTSDSATHGYVGGSISSVIQTGLTECFPPTPGHLLSVTEDPNHIFTTMTGDVSFAYTWAQNAAPNSQTTTVINTSQSAFMRPSFSTFYAHAREGYIPITLPNCRTLTADLAI